MGFHLTAQHTFLRKLYNKSHGRPLLANPRNMHPKSILIAFAHFVAIAAVGPPSPGYRSDLITEKPPSIDRTASS